MADCRRTETELVRDGARSAAREEFAKDQQQAAIQLPELQLVEPPFKPVPMLVQAVRRASVPDAGLDWLMRKLSAAVSA